MHPDATRKSGLAGLGREYSLGEIFTMTSYGPARALGLKDRGHLEPGSLADLRCYTKQDDMITMFPKPCLGHAPGTNCYPGWQTSYHTTW